MGEWRGTTGGGGVEAGTMPLSISPDGLISDHSDYGIYNVLTHRYGLCRLQMDLLLICITLFSRRLCDQKV